MPVSHFMTYYSGNTGITAYNQPPQGWADTKYRVITFKAPPSETLLNWLATWATKAVGGTWVLNEDTSDYPGIPMNAQFVSNGQLFYGLSPGDVLSYWVNSDASDLVEVTDAGGVWVNTAYRTITLLEPPTGDQLEWLNFCGVKQT